MARGLLRSRLFAFSRFLLFFLLACQWTTSERTRKAGKDSIERIKRLIDEKARREFAQSDAVSLPEPAARNPAARRNHDELAVNGQDGEYLQGDLELAEWQAVLLQRHLGQERGSGLWRRKRKVGRNLFTSAGIVDGRSASTLLTTCQNRRGTRFGRRLPSGSGRRVYALPRAAPTWTGWSSSTAAAAPPSWAGPAALRASQSPPLAATLSA